MTTGLLRRVATWRTWDEPDRQIAIAQHVERDIFVVFPLAWVQRHGDRRAIARAKERIAEVEAKTDGKGLASGSVLLAFSEHEEQPVQQQFAPEVARRLI